MPPCLSSSSPTPEKRAAQNEGSSSRCYRRGAPLPPRQKLAWTLGSTARRTVHDTTAMTDVWPAEPSQTWRPSCKAAVSICTRVRHARETTQLQWRGHRCCPARRPLRRSSQQLTSSGRSTLTPTSPFTAPTVFSRSRSRPGRTVHARLPASQGPSHDSRVVTCCAQDISIAAVPWHLREQSLPPRQAICRQGYPLVFPQSWYGVA